jgi:hypothetical protein
LPQQRLKREKNKAISKVLRDVAGTPHPKFFDGAPSGFDGSLSKWELASVISNSLCAISR